MKVVIAACDSVEEDAKRIEADLAAFLEEHGHEVQPLALPALGPLPAALSTVACHRLLDLSASADVLLCLSGIGAILPHPNKIVWLLDPGPLASGPANDPRRLADFRQQFVNRSVTAALREARRLFVPSHFGKQRLRELGVRQAQVVQPPRDARKTMFKRNAGPELLCLAPLVESQRPHLLVEALASVAEPTRARWLAPFADTDLLHQVRAQAQDLGVAKRLTVEVRKVDRSEQEYLLSQALALVHLQVEGWLIGSALRRAASLGVPVLLCRDAGAGSEIFIQDAIDQLPEPNVNAIAEGIARIISTGRPTENAYRKATAGSRAGFASLLKAMNS